MACLQFDRDIGKPARALIHSATLLEPEGNKETTMIVFNKYFKQWTENRQKLIVVKNCSYKPLLHCGNTSAYKTVLGNNVCYHVIPVQYAVNDW